MRPPLLHGLVGLLLWSCQPPSSPSPPPKVTNSAPSPSTQKWREWADSLTLERQRLILESLLRTAEREGWAGAVRYCHTAAESLTFYQSQKATFQRVALRYRNQKNALADSLDQLIYKSFASSGEKQSIVIPMEDGTLRYYRPIFLSMSQCLKCHGKSEDIDGEALAEIRKRYPKDQAVGFALGELRGLWKGIIHP
ncbi:MAG: DUF3365 domain-containing protein [Bacteroidia bacterium]|nr:DUF3365 domain-containing protein [Bacteroidia bacterium]MDW8014643.1 DUF3365 domain-containing protein [Bacteroidia bacterium]